MMLSSHLLHTALYATHLKCGIKLNSLDTIFNLNADTFFYFSYFLDAFLEPGFEWEKGEILIIVTLGLWSSQVVNVW